MSISSFAVGTVYLAFNTNITQLGFINNRDYPGGPSAFEKNTSSAPLNTAFVLSNWCADALMKVPGVYSTCSLLYLVPYAAGSEVANSFLQILGEAQKGKAWSREYATSFTDRRMRGVPIPPPPHSNSSRHSNVEVDVAFDMKHRTHEIPLPSVLEDDDTVLRAV
ncbi:hypothetical protein BU15DRAFT_75476 [Melanogaster broomeanus]|nr:hypothetical protein BU15DRAFT_75476 [Melanogaster broomeanus]